MTPKFPNYTKFLHFVLGKKKLLTHPTIPLIYLFSFELATGLKMIIDSHWSILCLTHKTWKGWRPFNSETRKLNVSGHWHYQTTKTFLIIFSCPNILFSIFLLTKESFRKFPSHTFISFFAMCINFSLYFLYGRTCVYVDYCGS